MTQGQRAGGATRRVILAGFAPAIKPRQPRCAAVRSNADQCPATAAGVIAGATEATDWPAAAPTIAAARLRATQS